jgi:hypothetical protein
MSATAVAAWVGAVSGLAAILWDFYKWKTYGPKLTVSANSGMKMVTPHPLARDDGDYLTIWVRNTGKTKTTLTTVSFAVYDSWWSKLRLKQSKAGIVPQPLGSPIPFKLDVGEEWVGSVEENERINEMLRTGRMWCDIYHSWSKRPAQVRIMPKGAAS